MSNLLESLSGVDPEGLAVECEIRFGKKKKWSAGIKGKRATVARRCVWSKKKHTYVTKSRRAKLGSIRWLHQGEGHTPKIALKGELTVFISLGNAIGAVPRSERARLSPTVESRHPRNDRRASAELTSERLVDVETRVASRDSRH